jgi:CDP-glucose 4,6-dehydratase
MNNLVDYNQLKNKRILITGHTGFKGAWLSAWLNVIGSEVFGMSLPPEYFRFGLSNNGILPNAKEYFVDIRDKDEVEKVITEINPHIIFHMAAQALVIPSYEDPLKTYDTNVMGTANVLQASRKLKNLNVLLNITSDKCYENTDKASGYVETDPLGGYDPYSSSKACAEIVGASYRQSFYNKLGVPLISVRAGNVIGGGDGAHFRICPDLAEAFHKKEPAILRRPDSVRPWQHVLLPLDGYIMLAVIGLNNPEIVNRAFNIGPELESCRPVVELAHLAAKTWGTNPQIKLEIQKDQNGKNIEYKETNFLALNCNLIKELFNWKPKLNFQDSVAWTFEWYKQFLNGESAKVLCQNQILNFSNYNSN